MKLHIALPRRAAFAALAAFSTLGTALAQQSWTTSVSPPSQGTFSSLALSAAGAAVVEGEFTPELQLTRSGFANLAFASTGANVPTFRLTFDSGRGVTDITRLRVSLSSGRVVSGVLFLDVPLRLPDASLLTQTVNIAPQNGGFWPAGDYLLQFLSGSNQSNVAFRIDDVTMTAVPEPASVALLLAGIGMVAVAARRRRQGGETAAGQA